MRLHQAELKIADSDTVISMVLKSAGIYLGKVVPLHKTAEDVLDQLLKIGRKALQQYVDSLEEEPGKAPMENQIGEKLPYKQTAEREYLSIFGPIRIKRAYYWKPGCKSGVYPLDQKLQLPEGKFSYELQNTLLRLLATGPYREALETVVRIFKIQLWPQAVQEMMERGSSYVDSFYKGVKTYTETEGPVIAVSMDCKGIPMVPSERSLKKKETKARREKGDKRKGLRRDAVVTAHFTFYPESRTPEEMLKALMHGYSTQEKQEHRRQKREAKAAGKLAFREPINKQVHAAMDGKENAFARLADQILLRDPSEQKKIIVLIDGAASLESRFQEEVKRRKWKKRVEAYILDIFHATEYLWEAGTALWGEKSSSREKWVAGKLKNILEGKVGYVIGSIRQILKKDAKGLKASQIKSLDRVITYFDNHKHMMLYDEYLQKGYPIGTGVIESACGCLVKDRTDRSGMKWSHEGVQSVLNLRAVHQNGDWDKYFDYYIDMESQRLYKG